MQTVDFMRGLSTLKRNGDIPKKRFNKLKADVFGVLSLLGFKVLSRVYLAILRVLDFWVFLANREAENM